MTLRAKLVVVASVVFALAVAQGAYASMEERGEELFREGVRLASDGNHQAALEQFERAMAYTPTVNVLWNIACCHVALGNRDLAVACLDRYMEHDLAFQESAEMQAVVADIAAEPGDMPDAERRVRLWDRVAAANQAVEKDEASLATAEQRLYGMGNRGVLVKTGGDPRSKEFQRAYELNTQGTQLYFTRGAEEALPVLERVSAYCATATVYHNIACAHLRLGHRDFAVAFLDLLQRRLPRLLESAAFQELMRDIAHATIEMDAATGQGFIDRFDAAYVSAGPPAAPLVLRTEVGDQD